MSSVAPEKSPQLPGLKVPSISYTWPPGTSYKVSWTTPTATGATPTDTWATPTAILGHSPPELTPTAAWGHTHTHLGPHRVTWGHTAAAHPAPPHPGLAHSTTPLDGWASRGWGHLFPIHVPQEAKHSSEDSSTIPSSDQPRPGSRRSHQRAWSTGVGGTDEGPRGSAPPAPGLQAPHSPAHPRRAAEGATARGDLCCHPAAARGGAAGAAGPCRPPTQPQGGREQGLQGPAGGSRAHPGLQPMPEGNWGPRGGSQASSGQSRTPPSPGGAAVTASACGHPGSPSPGEEKASRPLPSGSPSSSYRCVATPGAQDSPSLECHPCSDVTGGASGLADGSRPSELGAPTPPDSASPCLPTASPGRGGQGGVPIMTPAAQASPTPRPEGPGRPRAPGEHFWGGGYSLQSPPPMRGPHVVTA